MVRIPSLSRRREPAPARDENQDGRIDERDSELAADREPVREGQPAPPDSPSADAEPIRPAPAATDRTGAHPVVSRTTTDRAPVGADDATRTDETPDRVDTPPGGPDGDRTEPDVRSRPDVVADRGPRPRTSLLATLSLVFGLAGALFVLTGTLAGYGMVLGGVGALLGVAGLSATRRRHIAGTTEAMIGMLLGLAAIVAGILAMTGQFAWPSTDSDWVQRFREWLDTQFVDRF